MSTILKKLINVRALAELTGINYQRLDNNMKGVSKSLKQDEIDAIKSAINKTVNDGLGAVAGNMLK